MNTLLSKTRRLRWAGLFAVISLAACSVFSPGEENTPTSSAAGPPTKSAPSTQPPPDLSPSPTDRVPSQPVSPIPLPQFAVYQEPAIELVPAAYHEPISPDLSNVRIPLVLSQSHIERLARDGFIVSPGSEKEFFNLYEAARYNQEPIFVTSDSLLHIYHLMFDKVLRTAEVEYFIPILREMNQALLAQTDTQYQALRGGPWEEAALRSVAFVGVASKLLDPQVQVPAYAAGLVEAELALIEAAEGVVPSPLFPGLEFGEDYTQYIARGHYTRSEALKAYFKSMMWYGRMTFRLKGKDPAVGRAETRSALLLVHALRTAQVKGTPALEAWESLYSPTVFFVGRSDDLTVPQYLAVMDEVYGPGHSVEDLVDEPLLEQFIARADELPPPRILGIVIQDTDDVEQATKGLRFMGQRFVPDAYIFRQLIYRNVGTSENRRGLPKGLDLMAAMGSERAYQLLDDMGETRYENYPQQMEKMKAWTASLSELEWTETLNNAWLYAFYPLLEVPGDGYPSFMRSPAWLDKQLNTSLGSWAELKHDTILYAKQVYAEMGGGPPPPPPLDPRGYVEPVPQFYARLKALTAMTRNGLAARGLLSDLDRDSLLRLEDLVGTMQVIAEKELRGEPLTEMEYDRILYYGGELEQLTMAAADSDVTDPFAPRFMDEAPQAAVIADVATDPDHRADNVMGLAVLEEAVGRINHIYAVVPIIEADGERYLQVAKGGVFSYYEFVWPGADRLTDEKWRQMLDSGQAPPLPDWTGSFYISESEYAALDRAILEFHQDLTRAYWEPENGLAMGGAALEYYREDLESLVAARQYVSHQLQRRQIRSFDLQSDNLAVITAREFWRDTLHDYQGDYPSYSEPASAQRGPYALAVTYTLAFSEDEYGGRWRVTNAVYEDQPPAWE